MKKKKLLIHSLVFSPDAVSTAYLYNEIAIGFTQADYEVTVLTTTPHYNIINDLLLKQPLEKKLYGLYFISYFNGIKVIHVPIKKFKSTFFRILSFIYWHLFSFIIAISIKKIDYVFIGSCTNGRIEDFRAFASIVKGRKKADNVTAWVVPGSHVVEAQIREEGIYDILIEAGFELRQPGCSACLAMNDDKIPAGKYAVSTSNRNFEGRQGPGARTLLASPLVAAAAAVTGQVTDPRTLIA